MDIVSATENDSVNLTSIGADEFLKQIIDGGVGLDVVKNPREVGSGKGVSLVAGGGESLFNGFCETSARYGDVFSTPRRVSGRVPCR